MKGSVSVIVSAVILSGCLTLSGVYELTAVDQQGAPVSGNTRIIAEGSGIYTARNALCSAHPGATVVIKSGSTGENLDSESPYRCK
ncbi:hypothetical protein [Sedimenticola hydrogenitrophicus]|uniref:hypothetical protein n=1 Tax=Sedimenticola hydrogenitrophicus TaxID=2967975 RepID=UPI0023AFC752|nr:hypothetical protein [Sedimenticola hydrogenitrophicus]